MTSADVLNQQEFAPVVAQIFNESAPHVMRTMLQAGVHFGHQKKRWNPKMKPFIFAERNGIHVIDLNQTLPLLDEAYNFISELIVRGDRILFVGTKKQAQEVVAREAERSGQFYINRRWLGGTLTNFVTIRSRLRTMRQLQSQRDSGELEYLPNQEQAVKTKELERLERTLGGMRDMQALPGAIFVIDPKREYLAIQEARRLKIPVIALTDTNCDPDVVDYIIPGNDDAIRSVRLITAAIADAAINGNMRNEIAINDELTAGLGYEDPGPDADLGAAIDPPADLTDGEAVAIAGEVAST